ncbi:Uncharacterised protein [Mobiluncus mulieris]|nr:Uncharacterised protein [Mobiluncus mulieris]
MTEDLAAFLVFVGFWRKTKCSTLDNNEERSRINNEYIGRIGQTTPAAR